MKMKKRFIAILMIMIMVFSMMPAGALATYTWGGNGSSVGGNGSYVIGSTSHTHN